MRSRGPLRTVAPNDPKEECQMATGARYAEEPPGYGWVIFAGTMLAIIGVLNFIYGIAGISNSKFYARGVEYVISDLKTWGWVLVVVGVAQVITAFGIWVQ